MPVQTQTHRSIVRTPRPFTLRMSRAAGQILEWCQTEPGMLDSSAPEALITAEAHLGEAHQIVNVAVRECRVGFARNLRVTPLPELAT